MTITSAHSAEFLQSSRKAHLSAHCAIFRHIATGLPHEPDGCSGYRARGDRLSKMGCHRPDRFYRVWTTRLTRRSGLVFAPVHRLAILGSSPPLAKATVCPAIRRRPQPSSSPAIPLSGVSPRYRPASLLPQCGAGIRPNRNQQLSPRRSLAQFDRPAPSHGPRAAH